MSAGDYGLKLLNATIFPQEKVILQYEYGAEDTAGETPVRVKAFLRLTWAQFNALISGAEMSALGSINSKMKDEIKAQVALLTDALDL